MYTFYAFWSFSYITMVFWRPKNAKSGFKSLVFETETVIVSM